MRVTEKQFVRRYSKIIRRMLVDLGEGGRSGVEETPDRHLKALYAMTRGREVDSPEQLATLLKCFEDQSSEEQSGIVVQTGIPTWSLCEHHLLPFFGQTHIGYYPRGSIVGLSKLGRLVDVFSTRAQVQERLTREIGEALQTHLSPLGVAVMLECRHSCIECRGVRKHGSVTTTIHTTGVFRSDKDELARFLTTVRR